MIAAPTVHKFVRFALVGGLGFIADIGMLALFMELGADPLISRVGSILIAMVVTWRLNRAITFGASASSQVTEAGRYFTVAASVALLNYLIYAAIILIVPACPPMLATAISTGICMFASFAGYGRFVFKAG